jgi:plastocyanin
MHVMMVDNDAQPYPAAVGVGYYAFAPVHITVAQGQQIVFDNPSTNLRPHTVTSLSWTGRSPYRDLQVGTAFDSSPATDDVITPGSSWTLDTSALDPDQYTYYCTVHPWMTGTFTVVPAA